MLIENFEFISIFTKPLPSALSCVHYNTKTGDWLEDGCYTLVKDSTLVCQCSHLTSFAVLVRKNISLLET